MLEVGKKAPKFSLENQEGKVLNLSSFKGKNLVVYFYPKDSTPGCTIQAVDFTKFKNKFLALDTVVIGVSKDSVNSHKKFCEKQKLKIDLLSDPEIKMIQDYGVWQEKSLYGKKYMGIVRSTFLIDKKGVVKEVWSPVKVKGHVESVLKSVEEL